MLHRHEFKAATKFLWTNVRCATAQCLLDCQARGLAPCGTPFHRLKSAQANKRVKLQVNVMNQQKDRRKDPGLEKYANLPGMQTNFAQGSNNDSFIPVAEALHLLNQEHLKA